MIYVIYLCKTAELLDKQASQAGPGDGRRSRSCRFRNLSLLPSPHTYLSSLTCPWPSSRGCAPSTRHLPTSPLPRTFAHAGPSATRALTLPPQSKSQPSYNKCTLDKAWSDPPAEAHGFFPLFSNHQAELLRHDHRPLCTVIICFCGCLAHQAESFPRRRLLIHLAQLF